ncbi:MAG: helix-turn-helix domain-containing protein [Clostridia bacterium]|nr:helix-turn-helix domain-containing protein [Clostridia bacterium]
MHYESELRFFCNTLKKCRIKVSFMGPDDTFEGILDKSFESLFGLVPLDGTLKDFLGKVDEYTIYKVSTPARLCYVFLLLPAVTPVQAMVIGPFLSRGIDSNVVLEIGERYGVPPHRQRLLEEYYSSLPVVEENSSIFILLETFGEQIWGGSSGFSFVDLNRELAGDAPALSKTAGGEDMESLMVNMELMQKRYDFENELMNIVALGQEHKAARILDALGDMSFERRMSDPVRNIKNYAIIMNTLLRKAAEQGGVHPLYINDISSMFAVKIEQTASVKSLQGLMADMFRGYCRLVRKHSMKNYSPIVRKVITLINSDLSANLTLHTLAESQNISPGYLSTVFKRDTGITLTEYITRERMQRACRLLSTTNLQIQTVALHCGIMDVQYFSKLFKKHIGKTPKEYRASVI